MLLKQLAVIQQLVYYQGHWQFKFESTHGEARQYEYGVLIALALELSARQHRVWIERATLLLVAQPHTLDMGLHKRSEHWWLWQRYDLEITAQDLEQGIYLQQAIAQLLQQQHNKRDQLGHNMAALFSQWR